MVKYLYETKGVVKSLVHIPFCLATFLYACGYGCDL